MNAHRVSGRAARTNDPEGTRRNIVEVATREFAQKGYGSARVDAIAARTRTSKRMIYYYFGSKEGLYLAVLEEAYGAIRRTEAMLDLDSLAPEEALRTLIGSTFDYYQKHPEFVRLVMNENIMDGVHMARSKAIGKLNVTVIDATRRIVARGQKAGVFRRGIDPIELHMSISALGIFNVANRATFSLIFKRDMTSRKALAVGAGRSWTSFSVMCRFDRNEPAGTFLAIINQEHTRGGNMIRRTVALAGLAIAGFWTASALAQDIVIPNIIELSGGGATVGRAGRTARRWRSRRSMPRAASSASRSSSIDTTPRPTPARPRRHAAAIDDKPYRDLRPDLFRLDQRQHELAQQAEVPQIIGGEAANLTAQGTSTSSAPRSARDVSMPKIANYLRDEREGQDRSPSSG